jgi:hypothetical protein
VRIWIVLLSTITVLLKSDIVGLLSIHATMTNLRGYSRAFLNVYTTPNSAQISLLSTPAHTVKSQLVQTAIHHQSRINPPRGYVIQGLYTIQTFDPNKFTGNGSLDPSIPNVQYPNYYTCMKAHYGPRNDQDVCQTATSVGIYLCALDSRAMQIRPPIYLQRKYSKPILERKKKTEAGGPPGPSRQATTVRVGIVLLLLSTITVRPLC